MTKGFIDIETGGFSIDKNGVCEIAIVAVDAAMNVVDEYHHLIKPYTRPCGIELVSYKDDAMAINGLTVEKLMDEGVPVEFAMASLHDFVVTHKIQQLIGHNIAIFDMPRINYLTGRFGNAETFVGIPLECTLKMARNQMPSAVSHKQEDLLKALGIPNPASHTALGDCYGNISLWKHLTGWKP